MKEILHKSKGLGIDKIDTAFQYDISNFLKTTNNFNYKIYSKIAIENINYNLLENKIYKLIKKLNIDRLEGLYIHDSYRFNSINLDDNYSNIFNLRQKGLVKKIGLSIYGENEFNHFSQIEMPNLVQMPLNILDNRFVNFAKKISNMKIDVFLRSIFLQGILLADQENLGNLFSQNEELLQWNSINKNKIFNKMISCLSFISKFNISNRNVFKVIVGFNSLTQFDYFINILDCEILELDDLSSKNSSLIDPLKWSR